MKKYIKPEIENISIIVESMLASSNPIPGKNDALGGEGQFSEGKIWNKSIWSSDDDL